MDKKWKETSTKMFMYWQFGVSKNTTSLASAQKVRITTRSLPLSLLGFSNCTLFILGSMTTHPIFLFIYLFIFITINPIHLYQLKVRIDRNETRIDRNEPRIDKINKNMICHTNLNNEIVKIIIDPHKHKHMTIINY
jgi:hypothetical protein